MTRARSPACRPRLNMQVLVYVVKSKAEDEIVLGSETGRLPQGPPSGAEFGCRMGGNRQRLGAPSGEVSPTPEGSTRAVSTWPSPPGSSWSPI